jgi:predicted ATP-grasp superfamily ATP-dependent carboligase
MSIVPDASNLEFPRNEAHSADGRSYALPFTARKLPLEQPWPPVILLGGESNIKSIAGSLANIGVKVYAINHPSVSAMRSRYLTPIFCDDAKGWRDFLLSANSDHLKGAVILCCSDEGIKLVIENQDCLSTRYILEPCPPEIRLKLLDKQLTYEAASSCGIAHPRFWPLEAGGGIAEVARTCTYPVILKPRLSQHWRFIGAKYLRADNLDELTRNYIRCEKLNIAVVAMEFIPGGDNCYCSYYTYIDQAGEPLFHFTKRLLRRHRTNEGGATYHITDWNPEVADKGLRLFRHVGLRGVGNVEFKRDPRDGVLKLIEVNARYAGGNALVTLSGIDQALLGYGQLTGRAYQPSLNYRRDLVMWDPLPDFLAFLRLASRGEISLAQWCREVARANTTPVFDLRDPLPGIHHVAATATTIARLVVERSLRSWRSRANESRSAVA